jgi:hypothetical protein
MMAGSNAMQINTSVPFPLVNVLQGIIILLITAVFVVDRRTRQRVLALLPLRRTGATSAATAPAVLEAEAEESAPLLPAGTAPGAAPPRPPDDGAGPNARTEVPTNSRRDVR